MSENRYQKIQKVQIDDLKDFYEQKIQPQSILVSIVGDSHKIDLQELEKIGKVTTIKPEELFRR